MQEQSKTVVFGGSGFIGTHLIRRLVTQDVSIISVDLKEPREYLDGVTYLVADVRNLSGFELEGSITRIYNIR